MAGRELSGPAVLVVLLCLLAVLVQWLFSQTTDAQPEGGHVVWEKGMPLP